MSQISLRRTIPHLGPLQIAIMLLALVTGLIHLYRALLLTFRAGPRPGHIPGNPPGHIPGPPPGSFGGPSPLMQLVFTALPVLFYLNFIGYVVLAGALYLPAFVRYQRVIRWILIFYTAITIVAWYLITHAQPNLIAYIDKPIELALIILLLIDDRQAQVSKG
jgi:hypothetical protein